MKIEELNVEYDKLQKIYGAKELMSIYLLCVYESNR